MNCREVQDRLCSAPDAAPDSSAGAALEAHVAHCAACRRVRDDLAAALAAWRSEVATIEVPDAEREWHAVRRRIRGGTAAPRSRWGLGAWLGLPIAAAAAVAVALVAPPAPTPELPVGEIARAENIEAPGRDASTMVFVDDKSGWLIVWASDALARTE
jgi:predicted anti-sigma-YlaC factor YlaD